LLAALGRYVYAEADGELIVHHYLTNRATVRVSGTPVAVSQETGYPWDGSVAIRLGLERPADFALKLRLPGWCQDYTLQVNGLEAPVSTERGYLRIARTWRDGDQVHLVMAMPVQRMYAQARVTANRGRVTLQRGPVVYCLEEADNGANLDSILLRRNVPIEATLEPELLGGVVVLRARGQREGSDEAGEQESSYSSRALPVHDIDVSAVPYFAWDNRMPGDMQVWIRETSQ
jgi:DUF1680 family protein